MKFDIVQYLRKKAERETLTAPCGQQNQEINWKQQSYLCVQAEH